MKTMDEVRKIVVKCFDESLENLSDVMKQEVAILTKMYMGEDVSEDNPLFMMMTGFLLGISSADDLNEDIDEAKPWHRIAIDQILKATDAEAEGICHFINGYIKAE